MTLETQQKILTVVDRLFADLGYALGLEDRSYEKIIQLVRGGILEQGTPFSNFVLNLAKKIIPAGTDEVTVRPEQFDQYLALMDTWEKAGALLLTLPEPDPRWLNAMLKVLRGALPVLRQTLLPLAKRLPHPPGGRPKKLSDPKKRLSIREEIGLLLAHGVSLSDAQERLATREDVGVKTIQRIWQEAAKLNN